MGNCFGSGGANDESLMRRTEFEPSAGCLLFLEASSVKINPSTTEPATMYLLRDPRRGWLSFTACGYLVQNQGRWDVIITGTHPFIPDVCDGRPMRISWHELVRTPGIRQLAVARLPALNSMELIALASFTERVLKQPEMSRRVHVIAQRGFKVFCAELIGEMLATMGRVQRRRSVVEYRGAGRSWSMAPLVILDDDLPSAVSQRSTRSSPGALTPGDSITCPDNPKKRRSESCSSIVNAGDLAIKQPRLPPLQVSIPVTSNQLPAPVTTTTTTTWESASSQTAATTTASTVPSSITSRLSSGKGAHTASLTSTAQQQGNGTPTRRVSASTGQAAPTGVACGVTQQQPAAAVQRSSDRLPASRAPMPAQTPPQPQVTQQQPLLIPARSVKVQSAASAAMPSSRVSTSALASPQASASTDVNAYFGHLRGSTDLPVPSPAEANQGSGAVTMTALSSPLLHAFRLVKTCAL